MRVWGWSALAVFALLVGLDMASAQSETPDDRPLWLVLYQWDDEAFSDDATLDGWVRDTVERALKSNGFRPVDGAEVESLQATAGMAPRDVEASWLERLAGWHALEVGIERDRRRFKIVLNRYDRASDVSTTVHQTVGRKRVKRWLRKQLNDLVSVRAVPTMPATTPIGITLTLLDASQATSLGITRRRGIRVAAVVAQSHAAAAGLQVNDLILKVAGKRVRRPVEVSNALIQSSSDASVTLALLRNNARLTVELSPRASTAPASGSAETTAEPPSPTAGSSTPGSAEPPASATADDVGRVVVGDEPPERRRLGVQVRAVNASDVKRFNLVDVAGAMVVQVRPNSPADGSCVRIDDVIVSVDGAPVAHARDLSALIEASHPAPTVRLGLWRAGGPEVCDVPFEVEVKSNLGPGPETKQKQDDGSKRARTR